MGLINWDLIPGFLMTLLAKENIVYKHPNDFPTGVYLLKVKGKNNSTWCKICLKLTITRVNDLIDIVQVSFLLTSTYFIPCTSVSEVYFEQVNVNWFVI